MHSGKTTTKSCVSSLGKCFGAWGSRAETRSSVEQRLEGWEEDVKAEEAGQEEMKGGDEGRRRGD